MRLKLGLIESSEGWRASTESAEANKSNLSPDLRAVVVAAINELRAFSA
jgi:hypothetical protein